MRMKTPPRRAQGSPPARATQRPYGAYEAEGTTLFAGGLVARGRATLAPMGRARIGSFAAGAAALVAAVAASGAVATTSPAVYVNIHVTLTDSKVIVSPKTAPRGANARF